MNHRPPFDNLLPSHGNGRNGDRPALPALLEKLSQGKYGSVTKEYESLSAQVEGLLSSLRRILPLPGVVQTGSSSTPESGGSYESISEQHTPGAITMAEIAERSPTPGHSTPFARTNSLNSSSQANTVTKTKVVPHASPVIVIDSDDDDEINQPEITHAWDTKHDANYLQLVPVAPRNDYSPSQYNAATVMDWQPCIQYQKVTLNNGAAASPYEGIIEPDKEATPVTFPFTLRVNDPRKSASLRSKGTKASSKTRKRKMAIAGIDSLEGLNDANNERVHQHLTPDSKENDYDAVEHPDSADDSQDQPLQIEYLLHPDPEVPQTDDFCKELWKEMSMADECCPKDTSINMLPAEKTEDAEEKEDCDHLYILKDDIGLVCRICGEIARKRDQIIDYQWAKGSQVTRIYSKECRSSKNLNGMLSAFGSKIQVEMIDDICIHPRHEKALRSHQLEGFRFLVKNLMVSEPGGCILAHAPGSGKTFMIICFIQSFLGKYPWARPLIILPKGILPTWKREFLKWQVEELPVYDFYSVKANSRLQQLGVLRNWEENRSILILGYKQFSNIICEDSASEESALCKAILLKVPSLLILDEGHTPRNDDTDLVNSLSRVETARKVVLSGTLFQNHVKEVFNILNLLRPKFLKFDSIRMVVQRIMSRFGRQCRSDGNAFYESVEEALRNGNDFKRKVTIIKDLREMTKDVLHYYKGDFLDELPGLIDFTVCLKLTAEQTGIVKGLDKLEPFRRSKCCCAAYMHPHLSGIAGNVDAGKNFDLDIATIDRAIDGLNVEDGVKTDFFMNILSMSVSAGEKMLVFSRYLLPLKFLERLLIHMKGWRSGKEMFMICGETSTEQRELYMEQFNDSPDAKILFGSIKACGEGICLVGASRVVILDVHLNPSVSRQAIGRAFRPGQTKKVYVYRLIAADSHEEDDQATAFRKELISKMWFEWSEYCDAEDFQLGQIDIKDSDDIFFENPSLAKHVKTLYRR